MIHFHLEIKVSTEQQQRRDDGKSLGKREEEEKVLLEKWEQVSRFFFYTLGITLQSFTSAGSLGSHTCEKGLAFFLHQQQQLFESHKNVSDTEYRRVYFIPFPGISKLSTTLPPFQVVVVVCGKTSRLTTVQQPQEWPFFTATTTA